MDLSAQPKRFHDFLHSSAEIAAPLVGML